MEVTMTAPQLPARPDLEQLRRQAKELLASARAGDPEALARFRMLPAFANATDDTLRRTTLALHDAQSVIARELGLPSWNALRERVEELTLEFSAAADRFVEAATEGRADRAARLLAMHPGIAGASLWTALVAGDTAAVEARLAGHPERVREPGGPRGWEPLLYVCHSAVHGVAARDDTLAEIASQLIKGGADPNGRFPWLHHGVRRPVLWGATRVTRSLPLARVLLELGADSNDGVTLTLAASAGDLAVLDLLREYGADPDHPWATDGSTPLYAILCFGTDLRGARWLVEHGADPDAVFPATGETPLHAAARTGDVALVELLVEHGADVSRRNIAGRTPYTEAALVNNHAVAEWLLGHGAPDEMAPVDQLVALCSGGDIARAKALLAANPELRSQYTEGHYAALYLAAKRADLPALEALLVSGFEPNHGDESIGMTALHKAAMAGKPASVRALLAHGGSVTQQDREFHATALICAAEGARSHGSAEFDPGTDYDAVGRILLEAGSPTEWEAGAEPSEGIMEIVEAWRRRIPT
jgi:ankyrin repeat protein